MMRRWFSAFKRACGTPLLAVILAVSSVAGAYYLFDERDRSVGKEWPGYRPNEQRSPIVSWDDSRLRRLPGETDLALASRLTNVIHQSFYHCEPNDKARPIDQLAWVLMPDRLTRHGYLGPTSARCGFCHQSAYLLARTLSDQGVSSDALGLIGHVVTRATIDGRTILFDPDYGVAGIEYPDLEKIRAAYETRRNWNPALEKIYGNFSDDTSYSSMSHLRLVELFQVIAVRSLEILVLALAAICALNMILVLWCRLKPRYPEPQS